MEIIIEGLKENKDYCKCPRCRKYHTNLLNHILLCDKCAIVILKGFPENELVKPIKSAYKCQFKEMALEDKGFALKQLPVWKQLIF